MVRGAGLAVRGDHGQGVQQGETVLRAELRGPGRPRFVAPHHAARVFLDAREPPFPPQNRRVEVGIRRKASRADRSGMTLTGGPEVLEHAQGYLAVPRAGRLDLERTFATRGAWRPSHRLVLGLGVPVRRVEDGRRRRRRGGHLLSVHSLVSEHFGAL